MDTLGAKLVDGQTCIDIVWAATNKPTFRTFQDWKARGWIPHKKIGHRVYYDVSEVRAALDKRFSVKAELY